jgi:hypothetical protein
MAREDAVLFTATLQQVRREAHAEALQQMHEGIKEMYASACAGKSTVETRALIGLQRALEGIGTAMHDAHDVIGPAQNEGLGTAESIAKQMGVAWQK